jgi:hypothetical protein
MKIRNPNIEIRNKFKIPIRNVQNAAFISATSPIFAVDYRYDQETDYRSQRAAVSLRLADHPARGDSPFRTLHRRAL